MREKAGGRKEIGVSAIPDVIWEGCDAKGTISVELEEVERGVAVVW
jgi:hypothetical protein